jgi:lysophospholipase L1-like esterase
LNCKRDKIKMKNLLYILSIVLLISCKSPQSTVERFVPDYALNRFESEIRAYERIDSTQGLSSGQILFYGSSSWRFWRNIKQDLVPLSVLNRGFGGCTIPELIHYADRMVYKYEPKSIVIYGGENDLNGAKTKSAEQVLESYKELTNLVWKRLPNVKFYFVSMKLSPSRRTKWDEVKKGNELIKAYSKGKKLAFIDINPLLFDKNGLVRSDLYTRDSLHINQKGYDEFAKLMKPILQN